MLGDNTNNGGDDNEYNDGDDDGDNAVMVIAISIHAKYILFQEPDVM